ncbi:MAG: pilus assembly protein FlpE [Actinobacteria bacterium]|nr:pilus assembly protein FlpE [Actinomycetota bacterium]
MVVGVLGTRGGVGASTFAALLAGRLARRTATALVDLGNGGGLEVLLGLEDRPGPRWPDLAGAGELPGEQVLDVLPRWGTCAVLSSDRRRAVAPDPAAVEDLVAALGPATGALVLDLDRTDVLAGRAPVGLCDLLVLVLGRDLGSVGGALAIRPTLGPALARTGLAVRGPAPGGLSVAEVARAVDLPVLCRTPYERGLAADAERGGLGMRGRTARAAAQVAATVLGGRAA